MKGIIQYLTFGLMLVFSTYAFAQKPPPTTPGSSPLPVTKPAPTTPTDTTPTEAATTRPPITLLPGMKPPVVKEIEKPTDKQATPTPSVPVKKKRVAIKPAKPALTPDGRLSDLPAGWEGAAEIPKKGIKIEDLPAGYMPKVYRQETGITTTPTQ